MGSIQYPVKPYWCSEPRAASLVETELTIQKSWARGWPIKPHIDIQVPLARGFYMSSVDGFSKWAKKLLMDFMTPKLHDSALFFRRNCPFVSDGTHMIKHRHVPSLLISASPFLDIFPVMSKTSTMCPAN